MTQIIIDTLTLDEKTALLRDLKEAYYSGATRIRFRERDVTYRSVAEMKTIIADLEKEVVIRPRRTTILTTFGRGY